MAKVHAQPPSLKQKRPRVRTLLLARHDGITMSQIEPRYHEPTSSKLGHALMT